MEPHITSKHEIEILLVQISSLLRNQEQLAACDRFAGRGNTEKMYRDKEAALTQRYAELLDAEYGFPIQKEKQSSILPSWQDSYDLI